MRIAHSYQEIENKEIFFFDLDDTLINTISGKTFPIDVSDFKINKKTADILRHHKNIKCMFIVSNQAGLGKFGTSKSEFQAKFNSILEFFKTYINIDRKNKIKVDGLFCTAKNSTAKNRKPNTGMLERCLKTYSIPKDKMVLIGDASGIHNDHRDDFSDSDMRTARNFDIDYMDIEDFLKVEITK